MHRLSNPGRFWRVMPGHLTLEHPLSAAFGSFDLEDVVGILVH